MPPVNIADIPNISPTLLNAPRIDPKAAAAPGRALSEVAQGIMSAGKAFEGLAHDAQNNINAEAESRIRSGWRRRSGETALAMNAEPDLAKRQQMAADFLGKEQVAMDGESLAPVVRDRLKIQFNEFADGFHLETTANVARETLRRADEALGNEVKYAEERGDRRAFELAKETGRAAGILDPVREQELDRRFDSQVVAQGLLAEMRNGQASEVFDDLDSPDAASRFPELSLDQIEGLRSEAFNESNRQKGDWWQQILNNAMNEGDQRAIISKEDLAELAKQGQITAQQRASYLRAYHSGADPVFDQALYSEAYSAISQYDPAQDPTGATIANLRGQIATIALPPESLKELQARLDDRAKPEKQVQNRLSRDFAKLTSAKFQNGDFGNWYTFQDVDNDPSTPARRIITPDDYNRALATQRRFLDAWSVVERQLPEDADPVAVGKQYGELFERIVLDADETTGSAPAVPQADPAVDYNQGVDSVLGRPAAAPATGRETSAVAPMFGKQPILPPGRFYRRAVPTVFGGTSDPVDNGISAFGGATGSGGREGVAIPQAILQQNFPGQDKTWIEDNVRVVVKTDDGRQGVFRVADYGTAESIWERNGRPTLDLTEGAVRQLGGYSIYKDGKLSGVQGLGDLSFAITTARGPLSIDFRGKTLQDAQDEWWQAAKPTSTDEIVSGLAAVRDEWTAANLGLDEPPKKRTPAPRGGSFGKDGDAELPDGGSDIDAGALLPDLEDLAE